MIGGKAASHTKPTALGTLLNAATYGMTEPTIHGTTKSNILAIWAANLRLGGSNKKFKNKKKGGPTYVENVDFLVGSNPLEGPLQCWLNNNRYPLNFIKHRTSSIFFPGPYSWWPSPGLSDSLFYFVIAVTTEVVLSGSFNDFGSPVPPGAIATVLVSLFPGSGYAVNDRFTINGGTTPAEAHVSAVSGGGVPTAIVLDNPGAGYVAPSFNVATTNVTGTGTGLQVSITATGTLYSGTYEQPLYNMAQAGPDVTRNWAMKYFPFTYYWTPALGQVLYVPAYYEMPNSNGFINIYYAQLSAQCHNQVPITFNRMNWESVLGNGTEYADAGLAGQQIQYPWLAGLESSKMDLGSSGLLPDTRVEIKGSHALYAPRGDADFADMIEDTIRSGVLQVGAELGRQHRGLNCCDLPGVVQSCFFGALEPDPTNHLVYFQPNRAGSILLAFFRWRTPTGSNASLSDSAGDTWTNVFASANSVFAYATAIGGAGNIVSGVYNGTGIAYDTRGYIFETDPGLNTILDAEETQGTGASVGQIVSVSVTMPQAGYIFVAAEVENFFVSSLPPHWDLLNNSGFDPLGATVLIMKRYVSVPGTYTFSLKLSGGYWNIGMVGIGGDPSPLPKSLGNIIDYASLELTRTACRATGLWGSVTMNSQRKASDWIDDFLQCANAAAVWSGFVLKIIPWSEVSAVGNGALYISPTASGPVITLSEDDLVSDPKSPGPLVTVGRTPQVDTNNILQVEYISRDSDYNPQSVSQPESGGIALFSPRKEAPIALHMIQGPDVARKVCHVLTKDKVYVRNTYEFTMQARLVMLEAMDLIYLNESKLGLVNKAVRIISIAEDKDYNLKVTAEEFIYGAHSPEDLAVTVANPNTQNLNVVPANVNTPIFLEPPVAMTVNNAQELWIPVSDSDPAYGGCAIYISTDGGATYGSTPVGWIFGNAVTGHVTQDWPAGLDPDTVNDLKLDLSESLGALASYPVSDMNNFVHPFYVEGSTTCGYELGAYSTATLTGANLYTLPASPNGLRRDVYHQPLAGSVDHPIGKRFAFLGAASLTGAGSPPGSTGGILKLPLQPGWVGTTLFFKFQAFNAFGSGFQDVSTCTPYSYTPQNCALVPPAAIVTIPVTSSAPGTFSVPHGLSFTPAFATVQMTSGGDIQIQSPLGVDGTSVYLDASDSGLTALVTLWSQPAQASVALSSTAPGNFSVPHGLAGTPVLSITQPFNLTGDFWRQGTPYTSTNLNLVASDAGVIGKDYAWVTPPTTPTLPRTARIALAPGAAGNFTLAHGLPYTPQLVIVRMKSGGRIWLQTVFADATNLYLTASDAGVTGEAMIWG